MIFGKNWTYFLKMTPLMLHVASNRACKLEELVYEFLVGLNLDSNEIRGGL